MGIKGPEAMLEIILTEEDFEKVLKFSRVRTTKRGEEERRRKIEESKER